MGADTDRPFPYENAHCTTSSTIPISPSRSSPPSVSASTPPWPKKRKLTRSPTPHTLCDMLAYDDDDENGDDDNEDDEDSFNKGAIYTIAQTASSSAPVSSSTSSPSSSTSSASSVASLFAPSTHATTSVDSNSMPFRPAKMSFFASLTGLTPEGVELARITRANTKANSLIGRSVCCAQSTSSPSRLPRRSILSPTPSLSTQPTLPPAELQQRSQSTMIMPALLLRDAPSASPQYMADDELEINNLMDEDESPSRSSFQDPSLSRSSSAGPCQVPLQPSRAQLSQSAEPEVERCRQKRRRIVGGEGGNELHAGAAQELDTPQSRIEPICAAGVQPTLLAVANSLTKTVRFDESKNAIFGYQRGSTIALSFSDDNLMAATRDECNSEEDSDADYSEPDQYDVQHGYTRMDSSRRSLVSAPWWTWAASLVSPEVSDKPVLSDLQFTVPDTKTASSTAALSRENSEGVSQSSNQTSPRATPSQETFTNVASSLDRLWSPPRSQMSFKAISSSREPKASSSSPASPSSLLSSLSPTSCPLGSSRKVPLLKRQSSMSLIHSAHPNEISLAHTLSASGALAMSDSNLQRKFSCQATMQDGDTAIGVVPPLDPLMEQVGRVCLMTSNYRSGNRGSTDKNNAESRAERFQKFYGRSAVVTEQPSSPQISSASGAPTAFTPPRMTRAASFAVPRQTPPPLLRREASTTALMDIM
ncbi:hypothetical protein EDD11_003918 [Mortierella claussenii]|nr:hypothetical protein EDD11_003918 [Mortierella claussenii]